MGSAILSPDGLIGGGISAPRGGPSVPIGTPVDLGHNQTTSGTALTITTTSAISAGDCGILVHYAATTGGTGSGLSDGTNTWNRVYQFNSAAPVIEVWAAYNMLAVPTSAALAMTFSGAAARHGISAFKCSGIATASAFDQSTNTSTGTATSSGLLTFPDLSLPNELLVAIFAGASDPGARTWGTGYTAVGGNTTNAFALPAWLAVTSATGNTVTPAWVNNVAYRTVGVSFKGLSQP